MTFTRHLLHPDWEELERICGEIERLQDKSKILRDKIDADLDKYSDKELSELKKVKENETIKKRN